MTAPPSFSLDKCVKQMKTGVFRHLPIVQKGEVLACVSMRDIAQQVASGLSKKPLPSPPTVADLMDERVGRGGALSLPAKGTVAEAVGMMRESRSGAVLVESRSGRGYGLFTERDYLTKVAAYDESPPTELSVAEVPPASPRA